MDKKKPAAKSKAAGKAVRGIYIVICVLVGVAGIIGLGGIVFAFVRLFGG